jgi:hypothetical protein
MFVNGGVVIRMASRFAGRSAIGAVMAAVTFGMGTSNATAAAAAQPSKPPVFSKGDQLKVVREVCGAAKAASVVDDISTPETVHGFITADDGMFYVELLSESYEVRKTVGHAIVFGGHQLTDENKISSHEAARTTVCATLLEFRGGKWTVSAREASLAETGFNGRDPQVTLMAIGAERRALRIQQGQWHSGSSMTIDSLYEQEAAGIREILSVATEADDCGSGEPCFKWEGTLAASSALAPGGERVDLELRLKGTYRNGAGRIVKLPAQPMVLRFVDGAYTPVGRTTAVQALWKILQSPWQ